MSPISMHNRSTKFWSFLPKIAVALTFSCGVISAQDEAAEEVYELDPFTVSEEATEGYIASNSLVGTRSNTLIKDVPMNIQVFTNEVTNDFLITSQVELERYNASMVNGGADVHSSNVIQQAYNALMFRGFQQNWGLRDGVRQYDPVDTQGLARVEIVKGPAAALYGLAYPGGLMNSVTKSVDFNTNFADASFTIASEGENRTTLDANLSADLEAGGKIGVRFNGVYSETKDYRHNSDGSINYFQLNLAWMPMKSTKVELLVEEGYREKVSGLGTFETAEVDADGNGLGNGASIPIQETHDDIDYNWNWSSSSNVRSLDTSMVRGKITHTFSPDFVVNGYWQTARRDQVDSDGLNANGMGGSAGNWDLGWSSRGGNATGWLNPNTPDERIAMHWHHRDWQNRMWAYGATAVYNLRFENWENTFTLGANAWAEDFITYKHTLPEGSENIVYLPVAANIDVPNPIGPPTDMFQDTAGAYETQDNSNDYIFASWQMTALDGRLKTNLSVNKANFKLIQWANGNSLVPDNITEESEVSPLYGIVYDVTDSISVFALRSSSLFPTTLRDSFQRQLPPLVGESSEVGIKFDAMDGRLSGTISYYNIELTGGGVDDPNAYNLDQQVWDSLSPEERELRYPGQSREDLAGDVIDGATQESKGFEADIAWSPNKNWQIIFSYAHNNIEITEHPDSSLVGTIPYAGPIEDQFSILTKYAFTEGSLEGLSMGLGFQHAGEAYQGTEGGVKRYNPSTNYAEVFFGYPFKIGSYDANIRFNVKNLTEQEGFVGWKATGSSAIATERYKVPTERVFSLTFGLHF